MSELVILREASDVTNDILRFIEETVEWFEGESSMPTEDFIDRFCDIHGGDDWDIEDYDCPAARKIMQEARRIRRSWA